MSKIHVEIDVPVFNSALLEKVEVFEELNNHTWCYIQITQIAGERFAAESVLGKPLRVVATSDEGAEQVLFTGFAQASELEFAVDRHYTAKITAVTYSYRLAEGTRRAHFSKCTNLNVLGQILAASNLTLQTQISAGPARNYHQCEETDFSFVTRIVDDAEAWMRPTKDGLGLEIRTAFQGNQTLPWSAEGQLTNFRVSGKLSPAAFNGAHYDPKAMQSQTFRLVHDEASPYASTNPEWRTAVAAGRESSQVSSGYVCERTRANSLQDFQSVLEKESRRSQVAAVAGVGTSRLATIRSGDQVTIQGLSGAEGEYGIIKVTHTWTPAFGYSNEFHCTPWKKWTSPVRPQPPRFSGVIPARVADNNDPDGCGRIKVQFYWQGQNEMTEWMTLMAPNAGPGRGIMFVPEIGDEVWVAFEEGDPERGRILGSTWNGVQKAPWQEIRGGELPANNAKWIRTKTGNYLALSDQPDQNEISIGTPNIRVRLIDKAQQTNGESVLVFDSPGHIIFNAGGRIHFRSKTFSKEVGDDQIPPQLPRVSPNIPARYPSKAASSVSQQTAALLKAASSGMPFCKICS